MNRTLSLLLAGALLGGLVATAGFVWVLRNNATGNTAGTAEPVKTLKLGHSLDPQHPVHLGMVHMKERLEALPGGSMTLEIYPSAVLGGETECIEQVQNGVLAMTKTSTGPMEAFIPEMQLFGLPYLFRDSEHFWAFADSDIGRELLQKGRDKNLIGLCYYDAGSRNFYTRGQPQLLHPRPHDSLTG